jgi:hypothetical protein
VQPPPWRWPAGRSTGGIKCDRPSDGGFTVGIGADQLGNVRRLAGAGQSTQRLRSRSLEARRTAFTRETIEYGFCSQPSGIATLKRMLIVMRRCKDAADSEFPEDLQGGMNSVAVPSKPHIHHADVIALHALADGCPDDSQEHDRVAQCPRINVPATMNDMPHIYNDDKTNY